MFPNIGKKIEVVANIAILVVACLLAIVLVKSYLLSEPRLALGPETESIKPAVSSLGIDWKANGQTLLLAISSSCRYCTESAPFYRKLAERKANTHLVAVLPQSVEDGRKYLNTLGVSVDEIRQSSLEQIGVRGTPSLVLVDDSGVVKNFWVGRLRPDQETVVLDALGKRKG